jgi:hypothetical protein
MVEDQDNGWREWSKYVLKELERLNSCIIDINEKASISVGCITTLKTEIAKLKVKSGIWGVIGGAIPVLILLIIKFLGS